MPSYRSDQALIQVNLPGVLTDSVGWQTFDGGDSTATTVNNSPGAMGPAFDMGGVPARSDITVSRTWSDTLIGTFKALDQSNGNLRGTVKHTTLDANKNPVNASTTTYSVTLKTVTRPKYDSSTSEDAKLTLVLGADVAIT